MLQMSRTGKTEGKSSLLLGKLGELILTQQGALRYAQARASSLGLCSLHSHLAADVRGEVGRGLAAGARGHRSQKAGQAG